MRQTPLLFVLIFCFFSGVFLSCGSRQPVKVAGKILLLDTGWRFHEGDDSIWATPSLDDRIWDKLDPLQDIYTFKKANAGVHIGWMRRKFTVPGDWPGNAQTLTLIQSVASEIYFDGEKIADFGRIDPYGTGTKTYDPHLYPIYMHAEQGTAHTLAIRIGISEKEKYTTLFEMPNPVFRSEIKPVAAGVSEFQTIHSNENAFVAILMGVNIMIFIVHGFFYLMNPGQRANLFVSLSGLIYFFAYLLQLRYYLETYNHTDRYFLANVVFFAFELSNLLLYLAIQDFLGRRWTVDIKLLTVLFFFSIPLNLFWYENGWRLGGALFMIISWLSLFLTCFVERRKGKRGAVVFLTGSVMAIVFFILFAQEGTFLRESDYLRTLTLYRTSMYMLSWLGVTGSISAFLAWDFSQTSRQLARKLVEVKDLSDKNLAVEKEKQDILAEQNVVLEHKVEERTQELNRSMEDLKAAQSQLIQSEKMASLGQLTAGIAHEIQNPLNFVNNFSDLNQELITELKEELDKGDVKEASAIADDIKENEGKINLHGKRAETIVKSMLQHSRSSSGQKEPTDLAALAEEYLNLAYHGMRAKDKSFNVTLENDFAPDLPKVNVVPQDIGRVLLNLYNNAFQAVAERAARGETGYDPKVRVEVRGVGRPSPALPAEQGGGRKPDLDSISIRVIDNGSGIPNSIRDKVFQPFFTTKPTGQGTGLGLSLSYDIVKAHGGELAVAYATSDGTSFQFDLPVR